MKYIGSLLKPSSHSTRVIIEGGLYDDWNTHLIVRSEYIIPKEATKLILGKYYHLDLVARLNKDSILETVQSRSPELNAAHLESKFLGLRPTTVITEDGRIFHDKTLADKTRLESLLVALQEKYGANRFSQEYVKPAH